MAGLTIGLSTDDRSHISAPPWQWPPSARPRRIAPRAAVPEPSPLFSQSLFLDALDRERKRADRSEGGFVLFSFSCGTHGGSDRCSRQVIEAVTQASLDTDVVGWLEQDAMIGVIRPLIGSASEAPFAFTDHIQRELAKRVPLNDIRHCTVRWDVYSPSSTFAPPDPVNETGRRTRRQFARDAAKRLLDIVGSVAFIVAFSPVFLLVSALVKLTSKGPVFFRQERIGASGRPFGMMKFRTMQANADTRIHQQYVEQYIQSSGSPAAGDTVFKIVNDPRITPIGHFLRRSSLDELPQFWNVLKGDMSLVGPRPPLAYEVARYKSWHRRRVTEAKPGITGLWQVTGRSRTTFDEMVRLDLRYARSYSVWTDLKILAATPRAVISGKGAL